MSLNQQVSHRIAMLRFFMIFGVIVLHTPNFVPLAEIGSGSFDFIKALFQNVVFRTTVPVLTCISGYLLFGNGLDLTPVKMFKKKFKTLVIPFLVFNLSLCLFAYTMQKTTGVVFSVDLSRFDATVWGNAAFGLHDGPLNYPLNFLRDLVALVLIAPIMGMFLRHSPVMGLLLVVTIFFNNLDGEFVLRNGMALMFYLGGMVALGKWNMLGLDAFAPFAFVLFVGICVAMVVLRINNTTYLGIVAPFLLWSMASRVVDTRIGKWMQSMSKYSFFIFIAHAPILFATWFVYRKVAAYVPYELYWVVTPVVTTAFLVAVYKGAMAIAPAVFSSIIGAGGKHAKAA